MRLRIWFAAALALSIASCHSPADNDTLFYEVGDKTLPPFELTERNEETVTRDDLLGKIWVASFFFTGCKGECSKNTASMARLHEGLAGYSDVVLVSISVLPTQDTPARLREYADGWRADPKRWRFLTGGETAIYDLIHKGFAQRVEPSDDKKPGYEIDHTFSLMIVDHRGRVRGYVDGREPGEVERLERRVKELAQAKYLPTANAALNAGCAVLLLIGYAAVRGRWLNLHKGCMLAALAVSALFLASYLYYHLIVQHGRPTPFKGEGAARSIYLAILGSHTVLAAVVAPLALYTAYQGLRCRLARHVRLARWTLPIWLYVSVTGVVVYWMLYHLW